MTRLLETATQADASSSSATSASTRSAVAAAAAAWLQCASGDQQVDPQLEEPCLSTVRALLVDATYAARREAAELAVGFYDGWDNALGIARWINEPLCLEGLQGRAASRSADQVLQHMETSILVQGDLVMRVVRQSSVVTAVVDCRSGLP